MTSAPRSASALVIAAGPSIEHSMTRKPASGPLLDTSRNLTGRQICNHWARVHAMPRRLLALFAMLAVATACGGSSGSKGPEPTPAPSGSPGQLPTATGAFGTKPTITFPDSQPSATLQKSVLTTGTGPVVKAGDLLVANYLGQIWRGKVFDNSYDHHVAAGFPIGIGKVLKGWDASLVGLHAGSRTLLVVPPDQGFGPQGNPQVGTKATDTLVFVIDIIASYAAKTGGDPHAVPQHVAANLPKVGGPLGKQPTISIPRTAALPNL